MLKFVFEDGNDYGVEFDVFYLFCLLQSCKFNGSFGQFVKEVKIKILFEDIIFGEDLDDVDMVNIDK